MLKQNSADNRDLTIREWYCGVGILLSIFVFPDAICKIFHLAIAPSRLISVLVICCPMYAFVRSPRVTLIVWLLIVGCSAGLFYAFTMFEIIVLHRNVSTLF